MDTQHGNLFSLMIENGVSLKIIGWITLFVGMESLWPVFWVLLLLCAALQYALHRIKMKSGKSEKGEDTAVENDPEDTAVDKNDPRPIALNEPEPGFAAFQKTYLLVYLVMMGADWLQGPYVYALYSSYGFGKADIGLLFIVGFGSSLLLGPVAGAMADRFGRKKAAIGFVVLYSLSCLTKLSTDFNILLVGRLLGGVSTSLLFSVFESWMVFEHHSNGFSSHSLVDTFSKATLYNGIVAIVAGLVAESLATSFGYVAPFIASLVLLCIGGVVVAFTWVENYGEGESVSFSVTMANLWQDLKSSYSVAGLGLVQSFFEATMYTFVFLWSPALHHAAKDLGEVSMFTTVQSGELVIDLPYGLIFACYMVCVMIGSSVFSLMIENGVSLKIIGWITLFVGTSCMVLSGFLEGEMTLLAAFLGFEVVCGLYFPSFGTVRSFIIPERSRTSVMNVFRIGLNFLVVMVLKNVDRFSTPETFLITSCWMLIGLCIWTFIPVNK